MLNVASVVSRSGPQLIMRLGQSLAIVLMPLSASVASGSNTLCHHTFGINKHKCTLTHLNFKKMSYCQPLFQCHPIDAQQQLLQVTADRSKDTMEHCRLLMILLSRFPHAVAKHGVSAKGKDD